MRISHKGPRRCLTWGSLTKLLNELGDVVEASKHIDGQRFELRIHNGVQGFYGPLDCRFLQYSIFAMSQQVSVAAATRRQRLPSFSDSSSQATGQATPNMLGYM